VKVLLLWIAVFVVANFALAFHAPSLTAFVNQLPGRDKAAHFVVMGFFAALVTLSVRKPRARIGSFDVPLGIPVVLALVTLEEFSQIWLVHRRFALDDLLSSYLGVLCFGALAWFATSRRSRPAPAPPLRERPPA
jgi:VanZ family protein